ncbi:uncharacterized protein B0I36DRAFT_362321 [Microdochium trichocladiopsis]|uniref:Uncharacterized protein n=1 Tax=Microdochium trichocladiopsis TaxID=1682393 RepID=A0A9P8Y9Y0_9PEZI|nr:uncharacterized protein B0I36DRAFT_362321 [Microdochium trichocladiopsis]KAH7033678.1 hypothetical protein B0I36DRAFT_362321 [Microdochium trichocladiopsis]
MRTNSRHPGIIAVCLAILNFSRPATAVTNTTTNSSLIIFPNSDRPDPDAWGSVPVPGFRLDRPYPDTLETNNDSASSDWQLNVAFQREPGRNREDASVRISLWVDPPALGQPGAVLDAETGTWSVPSNVSDTWNVRLISIASGGYLQLRAVDDPNDDVDGSCPESVLSPACIAQLRADLVAHPAVLDGGDASLRNISLPGESCEGYYGYRDQSLSTGDRFNSTRVIAQDLAGKNGEGTDNWDRYGSGTFPFIIIWGHSNTTEQGQRLPDDHVTFACVKVDSVAPGVQMPQMVSAGHSMARGGGAFTRAGIMAAANGHQGGLQALGRTELSSQEASTSKGRSLEAWGACKAVINKVLDGCTVVIDEGLDLTLFDIASVLVRHAGRRDLAVCLDLFCSSFDVHEKLWHCLGAALDGGEEFYEFSVDETAGSVTCPYHEGQRCIVISSGFKLAQYEPLSIVFRQL